MARYLILPMQPTPNGRMHIGHGGGTYLRADLIARNLRLHGHDVEMFSGSDGYENWILAEALRTGTEPEAVCQTYHRAIEADLGELDIAFDVWIDPLSGEHRDPYRATHERNLERLRTTGGAVLEVENVPYSVESGNSLMGTWIAGECPVCSATSGGSSCVKCGAHFQPEELINPRARLEDGDIEWCRMKSWFARPLDLQEVLRRINARGLREWVETPAIRYVENAGARVRLSGEGTWGVKSSLVGADSVLANCYFLYAAYCGEVYAARRHERIPALDPQSGVNVIGVFGTDNTTPGIVVPEVLAQGSEGTLKPFDSVVANGMLSFEGSKCSTSKRHGIWLSEVLQSKTITSDELRYALSFARLDSQHDDLSLAAIVQKANVLRKARTKLVPNAISGLGTKAPILSSRLEDALERQALNLSPDHTDVAAAVAELEQWLDREDKADEDWLLGVSLLGEPIVPKLARAVWGALGFAGAPAVAAAKIGPVTTKRYQQPVDEGPLSAAELQPYVHIGTE